MIAYEVNFDGLVGPTHHYAGLAKGNLASIHNAYTTANPKAAALQGLKKMRLLHELGIKQAFFPPHLRPNLSLLYQLGFTGTSAQQVTKAYQYSPQLLSACFSASSMWTANAAMVSPSSDCADRKLHLTPANLISNFHRHQEATFYYQLLGYIFGDERYFAIHQPLPASFHTSDEGAANHNRISTHHAKPGVNVFVYGKKAFARNLNEPVTFPARQTLEASEAIARAHQLDSVKTVFVKQTALAIDQGVFHNDVIAVANENVLLIHEKAWENQYSVLETIQEKLGEKLIILEVLDAELSLADAVNSYLFNSQLITCPNGNMALISPLECSHNPAVKRYIDTIIADPTNPITAVHYLEVKQSMSNGGGPACLRLRVVMNTEELTAIKPQFLINDARLNHLEQWVTNYYRDRLDIYDLCDPDLITESYTALEALANWLDLTSVYSFQHV